MFVKYKVTINWRSKIRGTFEGDEKEIYYIRLNILVINR